MPRLPRYVLPPSPAVAEPFSIVLYNTSGTTRGHISSPQVCRAGAVPFLARPYRASTCAAPGDRSMEFVHGKLYSSAKGCVRMAHRNLRAFAPLCSASSTRRSRRAVPRMRTPSSFYRPQSRLMMQSPPHLHVLKPPELMLVLLSPLISNRRRHAPRRIARSRLTGRP